MQNVIIKHLDGSSIADKMFVAESEQPDVYYISDAEIQALQNYPNVMLGVCGGLLEIQFPVDVPKKFFSSIVPF